MTSLVARLVARRWLIYAGGLGLVLTVRTLLPSSPMRALGVSLVVGAMVLTYAGERWDEADRPDVRSGLVGIAVVGVVAGLWLSLTGQLPGLVFLAGGLLFLDRGVRGGASQ